MSSAKLKPFLDPRIRAAWSARRLGVGNLVFVFMSNLSQIAVGWIYTAFIRLSLTTRLFISHAYPAHMTHANGVGYGHAPGDAAAFPGLDSRLNGNISRLGLPSGGKKEREPSDPLLIDEPYR
jgi:hypothetical protein